MSPSVGDPTLLDRTLDSVTDDNGEFRFGIVPAGEYTVSINPSTLPSDMILVGETAQRVVVEKGEREQIVFVLRRASARERILVKPP